MKDDKDQIIIEFIEETKRLKGLITAKDKAYNFLLRHAHVEFSESDWEWLDAARDAS